MTGIEPFIGKDDHGRYLQWIADNPRGFVLSRHKASEENDPDLSAEKPPVLHKARCMKVSTLPQDGRCWTIYSKYCSRDKETLEEWARNHKSKSRHCHICNP